jgi:Uncharacterized protein conserved in archaea
VTQWIESTELGRERGPAGLLRAWADLLVRPRQFFHTKVAPGDQAPGITFAAAVVLVAEGSRVAVFDGSYPVVGGQPVLSAVLWVLLATVLVAPAGLHLVAALQTVLLVATLENRAGVSETVQVICYALAPCAFAGVPSLWVQAAVALWGAGLLVAGVAAVHDVSPVTGLAVAAVPAVLVFGYGFDGVDAVLAAADALRVAAPL